MTTDEQVLAKMRETIYARSWGGPGLCEQGLAEAMAYRATLETEARTVFDEQILGGHHPVNAVEVVEWLQEQGRLPSAPPLAVSRAS